MNNSVLKWNDYAVTNAYVNSVSDTSENEINITKRHYHDPIFFSLMPNLRNKKVLDVGCGNGYMLKRLCKKEQSCELYGIDLRNMVSEAINGGNPTKIHFEEGSCYKIPFKNTFFDVVISSLVFHWIKDIYKAVKEIHRVLKPGGICIMSSINPKTFHVGNWVDKNTENPKYIIKEDISKPKKFEVYINKTVGPLAYYMKPVNTYLNAFKQSGFKTTKLYEPKIEQVAIIKKFPCLKKYKAHPLYLFIQSSK